jgi:hypothetical protein
MDSGRKGELLVALGFEPAFSAIPAAQVCNEEGKVDNLLWFQFEVVSIAGDPPARLLEEATKQLLQG